MKNDETIDLSALIDEVREETELTQIMFENINKCSLVCKFNTKRSKGYENIKPRRSKSGSVCSGNFERHN